MKDMYFNFVFSSVRYFRGHTVYPKIKCSWIAAGKYKTKMEGKKKKKEKIVTNLGQMSSHRIFWIALTFVHSRIMFLYSFRPLRGHKETLYEGGIRSVLV